MDLSCIIVYGVKLTEKEIETLLLTHDVILKGGINEQTLNDNTSNWPWFPEELQWITYISNEEDINKKSIILGVLGRPINIYGGLNVQKLMDRINHKERIQQQLSLLTNKKAKTYIESIVILDDDEHL